jgi:hypothetical protein
VLFVKNVKKGDGDAAFPLFVSPTAAPFAWIFLGKFEARPAPRTFGRQPFVPVHIFYSQSSEENAPLAAAR